MKHLEITVEEPEQTKTPKLWKLLYSVSTKVSKILEHSRTVNEDWIAQTDLKKDFEELFSVLLMKYSDFEFLSNYFNDDDSLDENRLNYKVEKNLMIFLPHIVLSCNWNNSKTVIGRQIRKFLKIVLIFWDKISFALLDKLLKLDIKDLDLIEKDFLRITSDLKNKELGLNDSFEWTYDKNRLVENDYLESAHLPSIYRISLRRAYWDFIDWENKEEKSLHFDPTAISLLLWQNLEQEIANTYKELYELFLKTIDTKENLEPRLNKLKNGFDKLLGYIKILYNEWIAFQDISFDHILFIGNLNNKIFNWNFDSNKNENLIFSEFLKSWRENISSIVNSIIWLKIKQFDFNIDNWENFDIKTVSLSDWDRLNINESNSIFVKEVFIINEENNCISLSPYLLLDNHKKKLLKKFWDAFQIDVSVVEKQINKIKTLISSWITLNDFISQDVNDLQFIYDWWKFILSERAPENRNKPYVKVNQWFSDIIMSELKSKWIIPSDKIDVYNWRSHNTSAQNIWIWINWAFKSLSIWSINLREFKIWNLLLKDCKKLYSLWEKATSAEVLAHINLWVDVCIEILEWRTYFSWEKNFYISNLVNYWVVPKDLTSVTLKGKDNLVKLKEWLWYIKSKVCILGQMVNVSNEDYIKISWCLWDFISRNFTSSDWKSADGFWPEKAFWRALVKLINKYDWDIYQLWDLNRLRVKKNNIEDLMKVFIEFIEVARDSEYIVNVSIEDWTWNPISLPKKATWYRDLKVQFTLKSWNTVEFQFHFSEMLETKTSWVEITNDITSKLAIENSLLSRKELFTFAEALSIVKKWPIAFSMLSGISGLNLEQLILTFSDKTFVSESWCILITSDDLYDITRNLDKWSNLYKKLVRLERILFDLTWTSIVKDYLTSIWIEWLK